MWELFSLHFKQRYEGAYRYLDRCGEFLCDAVASLEALPSESQPTGAKFDIPELGIHCAVDTAELVVTQEFHDDTKAFVQTCERLEEMVQRHFTPGVIASNGFAVKVNWPIKNDNQLNPASLKYWGDAAVEIGKMIGMEPSRQRLDYHFSAGSMTLQILLGPLTFETIRKVEHNVPAHELKSKRLRAERLNKQSRNIHLTAPHAIQAQFDLVEQLPPVGSLRRHFGELLKARDSLLANLSF